MKALLLVVAAIYLLFSAVVAAGNVGSIDGAFMSSIATIAVWVGVIGAGALLWFAQWKANEKPYLDSLEPDSKYRGIGKDAK